MHPSKNRFEKVYCNEPTDEYDCGCGNDSPGSVSIIYSIAFWEEIILYGDTPILDLGIWYYANLFRGELVIRYPQAWDDGQEASFAKSILSFIRSKHPKKLRSFEHTNSLEWIAWDPEDYETIRDNLIPYQNLPLPIEYVPDDQ